MDKLQAMEKYKQDQIWMQRGHTLWLALLDQGGHKLQSVMCAHDLTKPSTSRFSREIACYMMRGAFKVSGPCNTSIVMW